MDPLISGRYTPQTLLRENEYGSCYQALDNHLSRPVLLHLLKPAIAVRPELRARLQSLSPLRQANLALVYHFDLEADPPFIASEWGKGLESPINHWRPFLLQMADVVSALSALHQRGMIHGRLYPSNLRQKEGEPPRLFISEASLGSLIDWPAEQWPYLAPEQLSEGQSVDQRADIYALGCLLYFLATATPPFAPTTLEEARLCHIGRMARLPRNYQPYLPPAVEGIILQAMSKEPAGRYQQADEMAQALRDVAVTIPSARPDSNFDELLISRQGKVIEVLALNRPVMSLGSGRDNDLVIARQGVAPHHLRLIRSTAGWRVVDTGSDNGTQLAGKRLLPELPESWAIAEPLTIGVFELTWRPYQPQSPVTAPQSGQSNRYLLTLTPQTLVATPGQRAEVQIVVTNQGLAVAHWLLDISGLPANWFTLSGKFIQLLPQAQATVQLTIHPPADMTAPAGEYPYRLLLAAPDQPQAEIVAQAQLRVEPFWQMKAELRPQQLNNGAAGHVTVQNQGNVELRCQLTARDAAGESHFGGLPAELQLAVGQSKTLLFRPESPRPLIGWPTQQTFTLTLAPEPGQPQHLTGQLTIRPRLSIWLIPLFGTLFIFLCLCSLLLFASLNNNRLSATATVQAIGTNAAIQTTLTQAANELNDLQTRLVTSPTPPPTDSRPVTITPATDE